MPSNGPSDAGTEPDVTGTPDGGGADTSSLNFPKYDQGPGLLFVDGLVTGTTSVPGLKLDDVRVCVRSGSVFLKDHALPDDEPMPLANYPGVRRGTGLDLGQFAPQPLTLEIYSAGTLAADSAWAPPSVRSDFACSNISCSGGPPCQPHVSLSVTLAVGAMNLVALVDEPGDVGTVQRSFSDVVFNGGPGSLYGTVMDVSGWRSSDTISVFYGVPTGSATSDKELVSALDSQSTQVPGELTGSLTAYEDVGLRFEAMSDGGVVQFGQSLDSIAYVSSPAATPPAFFGVRENFVFALVGSPNDTTSVLQNGGRNPTFDGTGLHILAIPYATPQ